MKNDNTIFWIIGIVIIVTLIINSQVPTEEGMIGLTPHYYKDGVEVFPQKGLFSIVDGEYYDQISFDVYGSNTGDISFSNVKIDFRDDECSPYFIEYCKSSGSIISFSKIAFSAIIPQTLNVGETNKLLWESKRINTSQFECLGQPVPFWVKVSAVNDYTGETIYAKSNTIGLTITSEVCVKTWASPTVFYDDFEKGICDWWWSLRGAEISTDWSYSGTSSLNVGPFDIPSLDYFLLSFPMLDISQDNYVVELMFYDAAATLSSSNYNEIWLEYPDSSVGLENSGESYKIKLVTEVDDTIIGTVSRSEGWHSLQFKVLSTQIEIYLDNSYVTSVDRIPHVYPSLTFVRAPDFPEQSPILYIDDVKVYTI